MGNLTAKEKASYLEQLDNELCKGYVDKKADNMKLRLMGFYGDYLEVGIVYDKGYEIYKKITTEDLINGVKSRSVYVINPGFLNRYYKQKWYREARNLI